MERHRLTQKQLEFYTAKIRQHYAKLDKEYGGYSTEVEMASQFESLIKGCDGFYHILGSNPAKHGGHSCAFSSAMDGTCFVCGNKSNDQVQRRVETSGWQLNQKGNENETNARRLLGEDEGNTGWFG